MNIENKKQIAILFLAIGLGLVAAVLMGTHIQNSIQQETGKISQEFEKKQINPLMQELEVMRKEMQQLATRQVVVQQSAVAPVVQKPESPAVPKSSLALRTPSGKRAYSVVIDSLAAIGGMVNPGDYVDILAHMDMPDPTSGSTSHISSVVFQNIQILAVGTNLQAPGGYDQQQQARSLYITYALTPQEATLMSFIEKNGRMQLILRAPAETETEIIQAATWGGLADYVFEKQGTELLVPQKKADLVPITEQKNEEVKPFIQIFQGGQKL